MSIKNINEIQSNDYKAYDQEFLKETLSTLANSGQRYGQEGQGITPSYFGVSDIFTTASIIKDNAYSYVECSINVAIVDTKQYMSIYGQESTYNTNRSYLQYYSVVKDGDTWSKAPIATSYFDDHAAAYAFYSITLEPAPCICYANMFIDTATNGLDSLSTPVFLYTTKEVSVVIDASTIANVITTNRNSFDLYKSDYYGKTNYAFGDIYCEFNTYYYVDKLKPVDSADYVFYLSAYNASIGDFDVNSYNIYYINNSSTEIPSTNTLVPHDIDIYDVHSKAVSSYGVYASNYLYYSGDSGTPYNFSHQHDDANWKFIINEKGTSTFETYDITVSDSGAETIVKAEGVKYGILKSILSGNIKQIPAYEKNIRTACLEKEKQNFIDTLNWTVANDYVSEYLDVNGTNLSDDNDYITFSTYFNPNFKFDVYVNSLANEYILSSSNDIHAEYCTNDDISKTIDSKVVNVSNNPVRNESFVADWSGIQREEYDSDYKKFCVYDRNILYKLGIDNNDVGFYEVSTVSKYILPFINKDNYWCINGNTTPVRATGYDTNAALIILYSDGTDNVDSIKMLSSAYKTDISGYLKTETISVALGASSTATAVITPIIDTDAMSEAEGVVEAFKFVKSSVVMSISKTTEEQSGAIKNGYITTFWVYAEKDDAGNIVNEFRVIKDESNNVLDMSNLAGVAGIIEANKSEVKIEPDKYAHDQLYISVNPQYPKQDVRTVMPILGVFRNFCSYTLAYGTTESPTSNYDAYGLLPLPKDSVNDTTFTIGIYDENVSKNTDKEVTSDIKFDGTYVGLNVTDQNSNNAGILNVLTGNLYKYGGIDCATKSRIYTETSDYFPTSDSNQSKQPSVLDTSSVLINHANAINRFNIFSFGDSTDLNAPNLYYSYIGTRFDDKDKTHLTIGTATETVDLSQHLLPADYMSKMARQTRLDIDFDNIYLNGFVRFKKGLLWFSTNTTYEDTGYEIYSAQVGLNIPNDDYDDFITVESYSCDTTPYLQDISISESKFKINLAHYINDYVLNDKVFYEYTDSDDMDKNYFPMYSKVGSSDMIEPHQVFSIFAYLNADSKYVIVDAKPMGLHDSVFTVV